MHSTLAVPNTWNILLKESSKKEGETKGKPFSQTATPVSRTSLNLSRFQAGPHISCRKIKANNIKVTNFIHLTTRNEVKWRTWVFQTSLISNFWKTISFPKRILLLEIVKSVLRGIYIDWINSEEISSIFSRNQIKLLPPQLTKPLLIMHDACDFVPRWIYIHQRARDIQGTAMARKASHQTPKDSKALYAS